MIAKDEEIRDVDPVIMIKRTQVEAQANAQSEVEALDQKSL